MQIGFLHKCCLNSYGNSVHANERKKEKCQDKKYNANRSERTSNLLSGTSIITSNENDENVKEI